MDSDLFKKKNLKSSHHSELLDEEARSCSDEFQWTRLALQLGRFFRRLCGLRVVLGQLRFFSAPTIFLCLAKGVPASDMRFTHPDIQMRASLNYN